MANDFSEVIQKSRFKKEAVPQVVASVTYGKALVRGFEHVTVEQAFRKLSRELMVQIRKRIMQTTYSEAAKKRLAKALRADIRENSLRLRVRDPLWGYLVRDYTTGPYTMAWLRKARKPIPIVTETGEVIFRNASPASMRNGKWVHPGRSALNITEKAKKEARQIVRQRLAKEVVKLMQQQMR